MKEPRIKQTFQKEPLDWNWQLGDVYDSNLQRSFFARVWRIPYFYFGSQTPRGLITGSDYLGKGNIDHISILTSSQRSFYQGVGYRAICKFNRCIISDAPEIREMKDQDEYGECIGDEFRASDNPELKRLFAEFNLLRKDVARYFAEGILPCQIEETADVLLRSRFDSLFDIASNAGFVNPRARSILDPNEFNDPRTLSEKLEDFRNPSRIVRP